MLDIYHEGDNIYINMSIFNDQDKQIPAAIDVSLEKPIVEKASDYKLSIIRFTCPLTTVPRYKLSGTTNFKVAIRRLLSQNNFFGTVVLPLGYFSSIQMFVDALNAAFLQAYASLANAYPADFPPGEVPYFWYDPTTRLFNFIVPAFMRNGGSGQLCMLFAHKDVFSFINSFPTFPPSTDPTLADYVPFKVINDIEFYYYTSPKFSGTGVNAFKMLQEFPTDFKFNSLQSLLITTSLPVRNEFVPLKSSTSQSIGSGLVSNLSYISSIPILTDYLIPVERFGEQNQQVFYNPTAEFRWTDLIYSLPIDKLSFKFMYQNAEQEIFDLMLNPREYASIKILLRRK